MHFKKLLFIFFLFISTFSFANRNLYNINPYDKYEKNKILLNFKEIRANSYFEQGMDYYRDGAYTNACNSWLKTLQLVPNHAKSKFYFESVYGKFKHIATNYYNAEEAFKKKDYETAIKYFNYIERIRPNFNQTLKYLEDAYKTDKLEIRISTSTNQVIPFTNTTLTIDNSISLYANGYLNNQFIDKMFVYWFKNNNQPVFSDHFDLILDSPGNLKIKVKFMKEEDQFSWQSQLIKVKPGSIQSIQIFNKKNNQPVSFLQTSADTNISLEVRGFDHKHNFVATIPIHWKIFKSTQKEKNKLIFLDDNRELNYVLDTTKCQYRIVASNALYKKILTKITVTPGKPAYVSIEDKKKDGLSVNDKTIAISEELPLYAVAYDKNNNYIGLEKVIWKADKNLRWHPPVEKQSSVIFKGRREKQEGVISIYGDKTNLLDSTGYIQVIPKIDKIAIVDIQKNIIRNINLPTETNYTFYSAGFTKTDIFQKFVYTDWALKIDNKTINSASNVTIYDLKTSTDPGIYNLVIQDLKQHHFTTKIHVIKKLVSSIHAFDAHTLKEINQLSLIASQTQQLLFYGYNEKNQKIRPIRPLIESFNKVKVWISSNTTFIKSDRKGHSFLHISYLNYKNQTITLKIPVFVKPAKLQSVAIALNGISQNSYDISALHTLTLTLKGFDKLGNYITNYQATWKLNNIPLSYTNLTQTLLSNKAGQYTVSAQYQSLVSIVTLYKYEKENITNILKQPVHRTVKDLTPYIHICETPILINIQKGEILYEVLMRELKMSLSFQQIAPYLNAVAHYSKIHNKNKIYPNTIVQIPYVTIDKDVRRIVLETFFKEYYGFNNILYYNDKKHLVITTDDKIIILEPEFLEKGAKFFPLEEKKIKK